MAEPDWSLLSDADGPADDLPYLPAHLSPDPRNRHWGELCERVCPEGYTFSASPYVLPYLLNAAASWEPKDRAMHLARWCRGNRPVRSRR